jgi:hypothetical protein
MPASLRILDEDQIDCDEYCHLFKVKKSSFYRACKKGLEYLRTGGPRRGGKIVTSRQAIRRYLAQINDIELNAGDTADDPALRSKARQAELRRIDRELEAAGI